MEYTSASQLKEQLQHGEGTVFPSSSGCSRVFHVGASQAAGAGLSGCGNGDGGLPIPKFSSELDAVAMAQWVVNVCPEDQEAGPQMSSVGPSLSTALGVVRALGE